MPKYTCKECGDRIIAETPEVKGAKSQAMAVIALNNHAEETGHRRFSVDSDKVRISVSPARSVTLIGTN